MADEICFTPIGTIHTLYKTPEGMPIQCPGETGKTGSICIFPPYQEALADLDGFERIILLYHFHGVRGWSPKVVPYLDTTERGLFATRAPRRPNPIGLSVVRLLHLEDGVIEVADIDILDGTPLLDIKPYVPGFDSFTPSRAGWLEEAQLRALHVRADERFHRHDETH